MVMNTFHHFMNAAAQAAIDQGQPLIDEALSLVIDAGFIYMVKNPNASDDEARGAGAFRVNYPTQYPHIYP